MKSRSLEKRNLKNSSFTLPIIVGLIVSIILNFFINLYLGLNPKVVDYDFRIISGQISSWIIVIILLFIVLFWEKNSLKSIGIKKINAKDFIWGFLALILGFVILFVSDFLINSLGLLGQGNERVHLLSIPYYLRIFMVITAGITEEIIFRGYIIERANMLINSLIISSIISIIAFTILHIPFWGIIGAMQVAFWAIPITILYMRSRNVIICIIIHILYDAIILIPF